MYDLRSYICANVVGMRVLVKTISSGIMRTLCDVCESAAALVFCAADEASLCRCCDEKVYISPFCNFVFAFTDFLFE